MQTWTGEAPRRAPAESLKGFSAVYRSAGRRARTTCILLGVVGFITLLAMIQDGSGALLVEDARAGMLLPKEANNFDRSTALVVFGSLGAQLLTAISYFAWLSRTVDNVPVLGGGRPSVTPRWSIGWWFVPFVNLVKPFQIVRELHDRLAIGAMSGGDWIVLAWWLTWLLGNLITIPARLAPEPSNLDALQRQFSIKGVGDGVTFLAVVLAIAVVLRIQWRAEARS
jgi:Domain of unknown function (DUF4328)